MHQLTSDPLHCFHVHDLPEVIRLVRIVRSKRLFQDDVQPLDMQYVSVALVGCAVSLVVDTPSSPPPTSPQEIPVLLRLVTLHAQSVALVLLVDECQHAGARDWTLTQSVASMLADHVRAPLLLLLVSACTLLTRFGFPLAGEHQVLVGGVHAAAAPGEAPA